MPIGFDKNNIQKPSTQTGNKPKSKGSVKQDEKKSATTETKISRKQPESGEDFDDDDFNVERTKKKDKKILYIAIGVAVVIALGIAGSMMGNKESDNSEINTEQSAEPAHGNGEGGEEYIYDENGKPIYSADGNNVVDGDAINPGDINYNESTQKTTSAKVYDTDDYLKDINGVDISAVYNITSRDYVYDYVSYVAKRGIIDDGMEVYWLEADYKGKKYRIQVPFLYFKDFDEKGVCRVQIEVLNIEGGGKVISFMQVVDNSAGTSEGE